MSALAQAIAERQRAASSSNKGIAFVQMVKAIALAENGSLFGAKKIAAEHWGAASLAAKALDQALDLEHRGAVAPGTLSDSTWAGPLAVATNEFLELVSQRSLIGRIPGFRRGPFNTRVSLVETGATAAWIGESRPKAISAMAFGTPSQLMPKKCIALLVVTLELLRSSDPSADTILRNDLIRALTASVGSAFLDDQPADDERPAGLLENVTPVNGTISVPEQLAAIALENFTGDLSRAVWIAKPEVWAMIAVPGVLVGIRDGVFLQAPALVSIYAPDRRLLLLDPGQIALAERPEIEISTAEHASVQLTDSPNATGADTDVFTSLWQANLAGIKAERSINWQAAVGAVSCVSFGT
jgi:hypothetical protein